eukprot:scaffold2761_cov391-Prasinococcus_capsulatus_cf.AAC.9
MPSEVVRLPIDARTRAGGDGLTVCAGPAGGNKRLSKAYPLLPEYLQKVGYKTHLVGKWHLGHNEVAYLPSSRGFDSAYGYWNGAEGYLNHTTADPAAYDFADGLDTVYDVNGTYSTYLLAEKARAILQQEVSEGSPFFLYLAFQNVHWPLEAPEEFVDRFQDIEDPQRRLVAAMLSILDEGIGNITDTLRDLGVYDETMIVFVSDNGGPTNHFEDTQSNNFPLRGGKHTLWEGGVRVPCIIRGELSEPHHSRYEIVSPLTPWAYALQDLMLRATASVAKRCM